jgi:hypothetical protein
MRMRTLLPQKQGERREKPVPKSGERAPAALLEKLMPVCPASQRWAVPGGHFVGSAQSDHGKNSSHPVPLPSL